jgi:hypothetical protein
MKVRLRTYGQYLVEWIEACKRANWLIPSIKKGLKSALVQNVVRFSGY